MDARAGSDRAWRFGAFALDVQSRELRSATTSVRLQEQPFEILRMMLERPGDVVGRDELRQRLWPDGTFVDFEHSLNAAVKRLRAALGDDADHPRFVETVPRRGYRFIAPVAAPGDLHPTSRANGVARAGGAGGSAGFPPRLRVAVLPFTNLSDDSGQAYFSDGLTEEMIVQLGRQCAGRIGVLARWSSMAFRDSGRGIREIGEALRADYLLEGSVRRDGDRVRITARLVETAGETHLWAETYERDLTDCLKVQADVAQRIARSLATELLPESPDASRRSPDPAAYQSYLRGRFYWNMPGDAGLSEAILYFEQALQIDPAFAAAQASLARAHVVAAQYYREVPRKALERAQQSVDRALELDPGASEARLALGDLRYFLYWDWKGAEEAYRHAVASNPSNEGAHRMYSLLLSVLGRHDEAVREGDRAFELDPLCLVVGAGTALVRYLSGDYQGAVERCLHYVDMDPRYAFSSARRFLAASYLQMGRCDEAIAELEAARAQADDDPVSLAWLANARAVNGDAGGASRLVDELRRWREQRYVSGYHLSLAYTALGDRESAFRELNLACLDRDPVLAYVAVEPRFAPLRSDERYTRLLVRLGLDGLAREHAAHTA